METIKSIESIINEAEVMRNCIFFTSPGSASGRRSYERKHSHPLVTWQDGKDIFTAEYTVSCSCRNVYASGEYTRNGKKTTLTAVKNSLKRLKEKEVI